jgi:hypothetical protein
VSCTTVYGPLDDAVGGAIHIANVAEEYPADVNLLWFQQDRGATTAKYKLEILEKADACTAPGEIGGLLRREGLYTSRS